MRLRLGNVYRVRVVWVFLTRPDGKRLRDGEWPVDVYGQNERHATKNAIKYCRKLLADEARIDYGVSPGVVVAVSARPVSKVLEAVIGVR